MTDDEFDTTEPEFDTMMADTEPAKLVDLPARMAYFKALAKYYDAHMDDPDEWGDPEPAPARPRSERRQRSTVVGVRLNGEELESLQKYATDHGLTISATLRTMAIEAAQRGDKPNKDLTIRRAP